MAEQSAEGGSARGQFRRQPGPLRPMAPQGGARDVEHRVSLGLLQITLDDLIGIVQVLEQGTRRELAVLVHWRDGSVTSTTSSMDRRHELEQRAKAERGEEDYWELFKKLDNSEPPVPPASEQLATITQVEQVKAISLSGSYEDDSIVMGMLFDSSQELRSAAKVEGSQAQARIYAARNAAAASEAPQRTKDALIYRGRVAVQFAMAVLIVVMMVGGLTAFALHRSGLGYLFVGGEFLVIGLASLHRRKFPLSRPAPDFLVLRYERPSAGLSGERIWQLTLGISAIVGAVAAVLALFRG